MRSSSSSFVLGFSVFPEKVKLSPLSRTRRRLRQATYIDGRYTRYLRQHSVFTSRLNQRSSRFRLRALRESFPLRSYRTTDGSVATVPEKTRCLLCQSSHVAEMKLRDLSRLGSSLEFSHRAPCSPEQVAAHFYSLETLRHSVSPDEFSLGHSQYFG